jgi:putative sigma-54 modulation protein
MITIIQFVNIEKNSSAEALVKEKLENLEVKFAEIIRAEVFFKEEKADIEKGKICEIRLSLPGPRVHASSNENSFQAAIAETVRDLKRQLDKRKNE